MVLILNSATEIISTEIISTESVRRILDTHAPGIMLPSRILFLSKDLVAGTRRNNYRMILTTEEIETLASALAICDWGGPQSLRQTIDSIRFIVNDHLGVKNV